MNRESGVSGLGRRSVVVGHRVGATEGKGSGRGPRRSQEDTGGSVPVATREDGSDSPPRESLLPGTPPLTVLREELGSGRSGGRRRGCRDPEVLGGGISGYTEAGLRLPGFPESPSSRAPEWKEPLRVHEGGQRTSVSGTQSPDEGRTRRREGPRPWNHP